MVDSLVLSVWVQRTRNPMAESILLQCLARNPIPASLVQSLCLQLNRILMVASMFKSV